MIITVTLNPAYDKTYVVDDFEKGETNIAQSITIITSGKGVNVSRILLEFGIENIAIGISDKEFLSALKLEGINENFVITDTPTRTNNKIVDSKQKITTELNESGQPVSNESLNLVQKCLEKHLKKDAIVIFSGSLPPGAPDDIYKQWIDICHSKNATTILDTSGSALLEGLKAVPYMVKPNLRELEFFAGKKLNTVSEISAAAFEMSQLGIKKVMVSMGSKGAILVSDGKAYFGRAPKIAAKSTVGAGDAMVTACVYTMHKSMSLSNKDMLAMAIAAGSASAKTDRHFDKSHVMELKNKIEITQLGC